MQSLDERIWKPLSAFGENAPLHIETTNSSIDGVRLIDEGEKTVPYITRSDANNGLARFVSAKNYEFGSDDGGCITVGLDTQTAFYQPHKFVTGQNVQIITGENLDKDSAQFWVPILRQQMTAKFNWGGNGATLGRMKRLSVMLPVTDSGEPDYEYMAEYTQQKREAMLSKYRAYVEERIAELGDPVEIPALDEKEWHEFSLDDIFTVGAGKRLETRNKVPGTRPFIGATDNGNGVTGFVGNDNASKDSNVLGVNYNGAPCIAFYHPYECIFTDDVKRLHLRNYEDNKFVLLFFVSVFAQQRSKYSYGYKFKEQRMLRQKLMLPVTDSGEPDYEYMAEYTQQKREAMLSKYRAYVEERIAELGDPVEIPALDEKEWHEFSLDDIFTVGAGKRLETRNKVPGTRPFIGATDNGNGVTGFVGNDNASKDSNVLGVNYNGAPCIAFYHPYECIFTDDVKRLHLRNYEDNKFVLLFFVSVFAQQRSKYSYGYKFKEQRMLRQKLMLPVTDSGKPDYEYMEQYAKNMMLRKYQQYLAFLDRSDNA